MKHHVERTSPKGQPFIGTCRLCGAPNLKVADALQDCANVRGLTVEEAMVESITGVPCCKAPHPDNCNGACQPVN